MRELGIFRPKGLKMGTIIMSILFLLFAYAPYITGGLVMLSGYVVFYIVVMYLFRGRKVILHEDSIVIRQGLTNRLLKYIDIKALKVERCGYPLSKISYPAITFYKADNNKYSVFLYHQTYQKEDIASIIEFIKSRNPNTIIATEIKEYLERKTQ